MVPRWLHKQFDLVVMATLLIATFQPWVSIDSSGRMVMFAIGIVMFFIWFHSDFTERVDRQAAKARSKAASEPADSEQIGKTAGRYVGQSVNSLKRWKDSLGSE